MPDVITVKTHFYRLRPGARRTKDADIFFQGVADEPVVRVLRRATGQNDYGYWLKCPTRECLA